MKKSFFFLTGLLFIAVVSFSQNEKSVNPGLLSGDHFTNPAIAQPVIFAHVIFGIGQSTDKGIFDKVKLYLTNDLNESVSCSFYCIQQRIFSVDLTSKQLKDPGEFIKKLKLKYPGTDFLIKTDDHILFNECAAEVIKQL
jgi:hypothetical protein